MSLSSKNQNKYVLLVSNHILCYKVTIKANIQLQAIIIKEYGEGLRLNSLLAQQQPTIGLKGLVKQGYLRRTKLQLASLMLRINTLVYTREIIRRYKTTLHLASISVTFSGLSFTRVWVPTSIWRKNFCFLGEEEMRFIHLPAFASIQDRVVVVQRCLRCYDAPPHKILI